MAGFAFPRYDAQGAAPAALNEGVLEERDGCLFLDGDAIWGLLWPRTYGLARQAQGITVNDGADVLAAVGSHVVVSGGELSGTSDARQLVDLLPTECETDVYWRVTSIKEGSIDLSQ